MSETGRGRLQGQVVWVTGAASGIGYAIGQRFAAEGASVIASDVNEPLLREAAPEFGSEAMILPFDLADLEGHEGRLVTILREFGKIDVLVNCGAMKGKSPCLEVTPEFLRRVLSVNLEGPFFLAQLCARAMIKLGKGKIINISSVNEFRPLTFSPAYSIAKAGLRMMTQCMALEWAPYGVQINSIAPGAIDTPINDHLRTDPEARRRVERMIPLGRLGRAEEIASAALFLASDDGSYLTGSTLFIDGGLSLPIGAPPAIARESTAKK